MSLQVVLAALLRHALTAVGGVLVAKGAIDADTAATLNSEVVVGALAALGGVAWSLAQKKGAAK